MCEIYCVCSWKNYQRIWLPSLQHSKWPMYGASVNQRGGARGEKKNTASCSGRKSGKTFSYSPSSSPSSSCSAPRLLRQYLFPLSSSLLLSGECVRGNKMVPTQTGSQGGVKSFFSLSPRKKKDEEEGTFFFSLSGLLFHLAKFPIGPFFTFPQISEAVVFAKMFQKRRRGKGGGGLVNTLAAATAVPHFFLPSCYPQFPHG